MKIKLTNKIVKDPYTDYVCQNFDINNSDETEEIIPLNIHGINTTKWNVGLVLGGSGSGKTTILKSLGNLTECLFRKDKALISNFDWLSPKEASHLLSSVGLGSVPTWLRPYEVLSNGEKYRAELAYKISTGKDGDIILIDEYTSVVDRDVAKAMSVSLQKYIRRMNKKIILASCHYDIIDWIMPDWICSPQKGGAIERGDWLRQGRPEIKLQAYRTTAHTWDIFKKHHYLSQARNSSFAHIVFTWNEKPVAIIIYKNYPSGTLINAFSISRIVVLPDYQGMGMGSKICEFLGGIIKNNDGRTFIKTINPALGEYFNSSEKWRSTAKNGKIRKDIKGNNLKYKNLLSRPSYCHEYAGHKLSGFESLLLPIEKLRESKRPKQLSLFI